MKTDELDYWSEDDFEDNVASALISMYESKIKNNKRAGPDKLKQKHISNFRNTGVYLPSPSRYILADEDGSGYFDMVNDPLPRKGAFGMIKRQNGKAYDGYFTTVCFERKKALPKGWERMGKGAIYEILYVIAQNHGITGERKYVTVDNDGEVKACDAYGFQFKKGNAPPGIKNTIIRQSEVEPHLLREVEHWAGAALQYEADKRFSWSIMAEESRAKVEIGCMSEEIKSLLYARSLPMTATGRKRPVLHLVESHKRRIRNGTDIDITAFLRGTQVVEMEGTKFTVKPPEYDQNRLSKRSLRYYG
jgi:hypothetical protein